jgi:hypothetical protein
MPRPKLDPDVADEAPSSDGLTDYDEEHLVTYLRLLDAEAAGADWHDVARIVLHRDHASDPKTTRSCWESHLKRAKWMSGYGYRYFLLKP